MIGDPAVKEPDVVLVGAGIMSATLAVCLKELEPSLNIEMFETLGGPALESSNAWNNAGTGHAANCELNYTPERSDGSIDISEALRVNVEFDLSRQLWSYLVKKRAIADPQSFIHPVPHMSFVHGAQNVAYLRKRFKAMSAKPGPSREPTSRWMGTSRGGPEASAAGHRHLAPAIRPRHRHRSCRAGSTIPRRGTSSTPRASGARCGQSAEH